MRGEEGEGREGTEVDDDVGVDGGGVFAGRVEELWVFERRKVLERDGV